MPFTQPRAVILDIDGTLIDSCDSHARSWTKALENAGYRLPFYRVRRLIGMGADKLLPALIGVEKGSSLGHQIDADRTRIFEASIPDLSPFPRAGELVQRIRDARLLLAVASSAKPEHLRAQLEHCGLAKLLDEIVVHGEKVASSKPAPDLILAALEALGVPASEVIMVGDTPFDVEAARLIGVGTIAFRCGGWDDPPLADAIAIYQDPADLLAHFETSPLVQGIPRRRLAA